MVKQSDESSIAQKTKVGNRLRVFLGAMILVYWVIAYDPHYLKWNIAGIVISFICISLQFTRFSLLRIYSLWFGCFAIGQAVLSVYLVNLNYVTLPPNLNYLVDVLDGITGISGPQRVTTDVNGFRVTEPINYEEPADLRIFVIGGSTAEQILLDDRKTFIHLMEQGLEARLRENIETINTGVSGLRVRQHIATLNVISQYHPEIVLILLGVNDWNRHIRTAFTEISFGKYLSSLGYRQRALRLRNSMLGRSLLTLKAMLEARPSNQEPEMRIERGEYFTRQRNSLAKDDKRTFQPETVSTEYSRELKELMSVCMARKILCIFPTQPHGYSINADPEFKKSFWMTPPDETYTLDIGSMAHIAATYNAYLMSVASQYGFPICDIAQVLEPSFENFYDDVHFNEIGAKRVAESLIPCILDIIWKNEMVSRKNY